MKPAEPFYAVRAHARVNIADRFEEPQTAMSTPVFLLTVAWIAAFVYLLAEDYFACEHHLELPV